MIRQNRYATEHAEEPVASRLMRDHEYERSVDSDVFHLAGNPAVSVTVLFQDGSTYVYAPEDEDAN